MTQTPAVYWVMLGIFVRLLNHTAELGAPNTTAAPDGHRQQREWPRVGSGLVPCCLLGVPEERHGVAD